MREVAGVGNEGEEVADVRNEQLHEDGIKIALPHEVYKNSDLGTSEDLVIDCICKGLDQAGSIIANEHPIEVEQFGLDLPQVRVFSNVSQRLNLATVIEWSIQLLVVAFFGKLIVFGDFFL